MEILKKGQEPIRTKFHIFLKQPDPLSGRKSNFQDKRGDFISDHANPGKKNCKKIGQIWKSGQYFLENLREARYNPDKLAGPLFGQKVPFQDQASPTITWGPFLD